MYLGLNQPTVLYDTNSVIRKHFSTKFTVQYKPSQAKLGELCPPLGKTKNVKISFDGVYANNLHIFLAKLVKSVSLCHKLSKKLKIIKIWQLKVGQKYGVYVSGYI